MNNNLILNIPHASTILNWTDIPSPVNESGSTIYWNHGGHCRTILYRLQNYKKELQFMTDWYTDELFNNGIGTAHIAPVSRLICDMERFRDPEQEAMEKIGMGICYTNRHDGTHLSDYKTSHRDKIIEKYYDPYHQRLTDFVDEALQEHKCALILDCHSFHPTPLPYEPDQSPDRPDICMGTDSFHTPQELVEISQRFFMDKGYSVKINSPYAGTIVPLKHLCKNKRVLSIMIELNRGLYLKEGTNERNNYFRTLKQHLKEYQSLVSGASSGLL